MSETSGNLTLSEVQRRLSVHARTMKELADRAAEAVIIGDYQTADAYISACHDELKKMVAMTKAHIHLLRPPA